ncbi:hypothetical protein [Methylobacterium nigriterrae]|uniref:hypothetical protein n=1 Tax=Methylobacterium nigriterrae TaxID=3127512 RepID=UPI003013F94B
MTQTATEAGAGTKAPEAKAPSPEALLKAAVSGAREPEKAAAAPASGSGATKRFSVALDARLLGFGGAALGLGLILGGGATALIGPRGDRSASAFAEVNAGLEANRVESARLNTEIERLGRTLAGLREASEGRRNDAKASSSGVTERLGKLEQALAGKIASLGERFDQAEREQSQRIAALATQVEKRAAAPVPAPQPVAAAAPPSAAPAPKAEPAKPEPAQTGSIAEAKPKPSVVENWALRDVYDGTAMLEDRRRRLVEVGPGDTVPGVGRVEAVERRGRQWVVVTRQGVITPQAW